MDTLRQIDSPIYTLLGELQVHVIRTQNYRQSGPATEEPHSLK